MKDGNVEVVRRAFGKFGHVEALVELVDRQVEIYPESGRPYPGCSSSGRGFFAAAGS